MSATTATIDQARAGRRTEIGQIPLSRIVRVELRKMFDTRSGFWLIASIAITGLIATIATIAFAPDKDITYYNFAKAVGFPITVILPMIALLSITSEWSQRSGLTTFTYVPSRRRVVVAKTWSAVIVAIASMLFAFAVGSVGNVVGSTIAGQPDGVGPLRRARDHHRSGQPGLALDRGHARNVAPQLRWRPGGVLRARAGRAQLDEPPGRKPGQVQAPAAMGRPALRADLAVRRHAQRRRVGTRRHRVHPLDRHPRVLRAAAGDAVRGEVGHDAALRPEAPSLIE